MNHMDPSDILDFDRWRIQLPIDTAHSGTPDLYEKDELFGGFQVDPWYVAVRTDTVSYVQFRAHVDGATTSGSQYPRSELREMVPGAGNVEAGWSGVTGTHIMKCRMAVNSTLVVKKQIVCGQIHDGADDAVQLLYDNGRLKWRWKGTTQAEIIDNAYVLGTIFDLTFEVIDGTFTLYYNGVNKASRTAMGGATNYFKMGCYTQSNLAQGDAAGAYGEVRVYSLNIYDDINIANTGIYMRNKSITVNEAGNNTTVLNTPTGLRVGDRMYAVIGNIGANPTLTVPSGWTLLQQYTPGTTLRTALLYRNVTGTEAASYTFTWGSNGRSMVMVVAYANLDLTEGFLGGATSANNTSSAVASYAFAFPRTGDWGFTAVMAREEPGTNNTKGFSWTDATLSKEQMDDFSGPTGTSGKIGGAWQDTNRGMPIGTFQRNANPSHTMSWVHVWSLRLAAPPPPPPPPLPTDAFTWTHMGQPHR